MNAWKVIVSTLVIFIAGVVTGVVVTTYSVRVGLGPFVKKQQQQAVAAAANNPVGNPWMLRNRELLKRMDRELDLTPEQHQSIELIIAGSQERIRLIYRPVAPLMNKEMQQVRSEIVKELTPEQRKKFEGFTRMHPGFEKRHNLTNAMPSNQGAATNSVPVPIPAPVPTNSTP